MHQDKPGKLPNLLSEGLGHIAKYESTIAQLCACGVRASAHVSAVVFSCLPMCHCPLHPMLWQALRLQLCDWHHQTCRDSRCRFWMAYPLQSRTAKTPQSTPPAAAPPSCTCGVCSTAVHFLCEIQIHAESRHAAEHILIMQTCCES